MHTVPSAAVHAGSLEGGLPHVAVEVVAVEGFVLPAGEDQAVVVNRVAAQVLCNLNSYPVGERGGPSWTALRAVDHELGPHDLHLLLDVELLAEEVDLTHAEPEDLALAEPASAATTATARTRLTGQGWILRCSSLGSRTDLARHGLVTMRPSAGALKTVDTFVNTVRT